MHSFNKILFPLALIAFGLNLVWEISHAGLYSVSGGDVPWQFLVLGAIIDVVYVLVLYYVVALLMRDKGWINKASFKGLALMGFLGVLLAIVNELAALSLNLWQYRESMPLLFGSKVGLSPVLQMAVLAPLVVFLSSILTKRIKI